MPKLEDTDIYIGLFGFRYGNKVPKDELSPTEQEYDAATSGGLTKWIYLIDGEGPIDPRMARLRKKAGGDHTYRHLAKREDLKGEVYASFIDLPLPKNAEMLPKKVPRLPKKSRLSCFVAWRCFRMRLGRYSSCSGSIVN